MVRDWLGRLLFLSLGLFVGAVCAQWLREEPPPARPVFKPVPVASGEEEQLREQVAGLRKTLAAREQALDEATAALKKISREAAPEPEHEDEAAAAGPLTEEELDAEMGAFGGELSGLLLGSNNKAKERIARLMERDGPGLVKELVTRFQDDAIDIGAKLTIAHALAQTGDPKAMETLGGALRDPDAGMMLHRLASHGLAFTDAEGSEAILLQAAHKHDDSGVRANASFGLARRGNPEGVKLYGRATDEAFENGDPAALQYLSGFALLGEKAYPAVRERLLSYKDPQAVLVLINTVQTSKDMGAVENLRKLAYDSAQPVSIQKAAQGALKALGSE